MTDPQVPQVPHPDFPFHLHLVYKVHSQGQLAALLHSAPYEAVSYTHAIQRRDKLLQALQVLLECSMCVEDPLSGTVEAENMARAAIAQLEAVGADGILPPVPASRHNQCRTAPQEIDRPTGGVEDMNLRYRLAAQAGNPPGSFLREINGDALEDDASYHARWKFAVADAMLRARRAK